MCMLPVQRPMVFCSLDLGEQLVEEAARLTQRYPAARPAPRGVAVCAWGCDTAVTRLRRCLPVVCADCEPGVVSCDVKVGSAGR